MSKNTNVPGMGENPYARVNAGGGNRVTVVPGMNDNNAPNVSPENAPGKSVPVVGFLYSISRFGIGEYWPIHIGRNTIGRNEDCDICLKEETVSGLHASLNVKQMKTTTQLIASIRDEGSKTGMFVNDEELGYEPHSCKNQDLITIGDNYKLLFILINAEEMGLEVSKDFRSTETGDSASVPPPFRDPGATNSFYDHNNRAQGGTMALDGDDGTLPGHTQFL